MMLWGVVVAGGGGSRFGGRKQFEVLAGRSVLQWSVAAMAPVCRGLILVVPAADLVGPDLVGEEEIEIRLVAGGDTRAASVRAGLAALGDDASHVLVHDAARPLVPPAVVERVVGALAGGAAAVVPVVPVTDTVRWRDGRATVDRSLLVAVQTPQGFDVDVLRRAHDRAEPGASATDDASLVDGLGVTVVHVAGDPVNMKITGPHDLKIAEVLRNG